MKLKLKEPISPRYIYVNPETNTVHLLMPIMSGTEIGLDNTCKSVYSLQEFFGLAGANKQSDALGVLRRYKEALEFDLKYLPESKEKALKDERLKQIETYLIIMNKVKEDKRIKAPLKQAYPLYPAPLESLMQAQSANLYSIILRPKEEDVQLRTTAVSPVFSAHHSRMENGHIVNQESLLYEILSSSYQGVTLKSKSKDQLIKQVITKLEGSPVDFEQTRTVLSEESRACLGFNVRFDETQGTARSPTVTVNQSYIDEQMGIDANNPATHEAYVKALLGYCAPNLFYAVDRSPFYTITNKERLNIVTQFFLAEFNIACYAQGLTEANFGQILENDFHLTQVLADEVKKALAQSASIEDVLIDYITNHSQAFQVTKPLSQESIELLKKRFKSHYELIQDSPHFDEFMLLSDRPGLFVTHQSCIATQFAQFLQTGFFNDILDESTKKFLQKTQQDFETVAKLDNTIPHKNEQAISEVTLDLAQMNNGTLQALYEEINSFQDPKLKETLLAQFKQERPDFIPPINAKKFLQHVAYGEQNEAEALLQKDPKLVQELLTAHDIPFTDYSGRTFTCTAYEYAYWAKDTHMQRMLEKYILQDEKTRQFIVKQVQELEKPINSASSSWLSKLFIHPKPRGLHYTTKDKQGQIINHQEAHFDLTPLKKALKHYVDEYNIRTYLSEEDWVILDKIWVEEVGQAQRDVPAHIAHEYCHPERSFHNVINNKANPNNLKRRLTFYNWDTHTDDLWFTPLSYLEDSGLGFSFAIVQSQDCCRGVHGRIVGLGWSKDVWTRARNLAAIIAVDEARTADLNQSLEHLKSPLITPAPIIPSNNGA